MTVKVRHLNETTAEARTFASVNNETELMDLIGFVKRSGGIYMSEEDRPILFIVINWLWMRKKYLQK